MTPNYKNIFIIATLIAFAVSSGCDSTSNPSGPDMDMTVSDGGSDMDIADSGTDLGTPDAGPCTEVTLTLGGDPVNGIIAIPDNSNPSYQYGNGIIISNHSGNNITPETIMVSKTPTIGYRFSITTTAVVANTVFQIPDTNTIQNNQQNKILYGTNPQYYSSVDGGIDLRLFVTLCYR